MKRILTLIAAFMMALIVLTSCGNDTKEPAETTNPENNDTPKVESPFKIPETDMRDWVVDYMFKMAEIKWTPSQDMDLTKDSDGDLVGSTLMFKKGQVYYGLPYINLLTDTDYEDFEAALKWNEGKKMYLYNCPSDRSEDAALGNDCSSAILLAYKRFDTGITAFDTGSCFPLGEKSGIYPLGDIVVNGTEKTTEEIVKNTPEDVHYEAFTKLQKGDMIIWRLKSATGDSVAGHTRMVISINIVKTAAGKLNPHKSTVKTIEQTNAMDKVAAKEGKNTNWWVNHEYTFAELRNKNLIPVTCKALSEERVEPEFTVKNANSKKTIGTVKNELMGTVEGNYPILAVSAYVKDAEGNVLYTTRHKVHNKDLGPSVSLKSLDFDYDMTALSAGDYIYSLEVESVCGTGEVYKVEFTKK
ncbi:MAG: hypothetical protein IKU45_05915 [Clostridia bacterium]|nr:hypothetical protein [Clostridia bacterium]